MFVGVQFTFVPDGFTEKIAYLDMCPFINNVSK